jgi:hypothetical protein
MRLPGMTTRRWMVAVAVAAVLMVVVPEVIRDLRLAHQYRERAYTSGLWLRLFEGQWVVFPNGDGLQCAPDQRRAAFFAEMKRKYERAATRPWVAVEPEPPPPL